MDDVTIYHNPACGTSRNTLGLICNAGIEPQVVEYLQTPPDRATLLSLIAAMGVQVREVVRTKEALHAELGLAGADDAALIDAMLAHPVLINRPIVVTALGTKLCRPSEQVLDILPQRQRGAFTKEDGEPVVDAAGNRIA
ncbi:arsenate reductase (glutaredoxin) [Pseudoxanthomonas sp. Root630]|uniref:arsenate reductase (glutaredoxin) n=1 Tax=Pseudoxanthomonas sp. Root630 TaxID=1736574 RepID=UPI0007026545|nr:arsenate reductase (glutaredoxin) [Pseudoxanthomonas sp. Root630]KRA42901.1 arsenate reductase [Pseudoxanthomonas sp. Root630]